MSSMMSGKGCGVGNWKDRVCRDKGNINTFFKELGQSHRWREAVFD